MLLTFEFVGVIGYCVLRLELRIGSSIWRL